MRVLVTGCAGFIGSHLTEALPENGSSVVGADGLRAEFDWVRAGAAPAEIGSQR